MNDEITRHGLSRRTLLTGGAGVAAAFTAGGILRSRSAGAVVRPEVINPGLSPSVGSGPRKDVWLVGTDGWVTMPKDAPADPPFFPDPYAPDPQNTYVFGFRNATGMTDAQRTALRGHAQLTSPILAFDEEDEIYIKLTNLGLVQRPDLFDGHTLHWHGFVNQIPLFDGVPELSLSVPIGRDLEYYYKPRDPGTYMYHCHFEDVEHVQMGMIGSVFVRPKQNRNPVNGDPVGTKYAYNDGDGSTRYDREFSFMLNELWSAAHYRDAHIQVSDWTDYDPSFWLMNGRAYPQTIRPNFDPLTSTDELQYQPISSLVHCNSGDKVLLRISSLGYQTHALTVDNIELTTVARDASLLRGRDGTNAFIISNTVEVGPGEGNDVIFTAPEPGTYLLYDHNYSYLGNGGGPGYGGMMTHIVVEPAGTLPAQQNPNE